jgi:hypothetical protein
MDKELHITHLPTANSELTPFWHQAPKVRGPTIIIIIMGRVHCLRVCLCPKVTSSEIDPDDSEPSHVLEETNLSLSNYIPAIPMKKTHLTSLIETIHLVLSGV